MQKKTMDWLEQEDAYAEDIETMPYSPEDIRIESRMISVFLLYTWIEIETLDLHPEFQRKNVWDNHKKSLLIESLMLRIPIPAFYMGEERDGNKFVIDGLQRLSAIYSFMKEEYYLTGLEYLGIYDRFKYSELPRKYRARIEDTLLTVNILDSKCPPNVKFDVFRRVNTGGIPLNAQEIRNAMATKATRCLLKQMSQSPSFLTACRNHVNDKRMLAQELCLRFVAFYLRYNNNKRCVERLSSMVRMLDDTILILNKNSEEDNQQLLDIFEKSMDRCKALLGSAAFSKKNTEYLINKPLFTAWSVVMAHSAKSTAECELLQKNAISLQWEYLNNKQYFDAITSSTATKKHIEKQFEMVQLIMGEITHAEYY